MVYNKQFNKLYKKKSKKKTMKERTICSNRSSSLALDGPTRRCIRRRRHGRHRVPPSSPPIESPTTTTLADNNVQQRQRHQILVFPRLEIRASPLSLLQQQEETTTWPFRPVKFLVLGGKYDNKKNNEARVFPTVQSLESRLT